MSLKIGSLWIKTSKDGKRYMSGILEDMHGKMNIVVFSNTDKKSDKAPDYSIMLSEDREERKQQPSQGAYDPMMNPDGASQQQEGEIDVSSIPF
jgi:uncharacterized protein (DUF736 family)